MAATGRSQGFASRLVEVLSEPYHIDGQEVVVGTSIGIALAPSDGTDPDQLLKNADMALYRAKADGRGTFRFFEPEMDARLQARRKLELELRKAVTQGEFEVYYQPIVSLHDNQVTAFEGLVRWNHPQRGMVMPNEFIPVAEDIGLIGAIGEWVLRRACAEAATWPRNIRVAINLSASQFRKPLVPMVVQALAASGLDPRRLELEITESVLLQNTQATLGMLRQLHELGVQMSMDDFGTGYSSLSYLRRFPFNKIKIDRSFIAELELQAGLHGDRPRRDPTGIYAGHEDDRGRRRDSPTAGSIASRRLHGSARLSVQPSATCLRNILTDR